VGGWTKLREKEQRHHQSDVAKVRRLNENNLPQQINPACDWGNGNKQTNKQTKAANTFQ
jgi:hypothetical protein